MDDGLEFLRYACSNFKANRRIFVSIAQFSIHCHISKL